MRKSDWLFIVLFIFIFIAFFNPEESIFAKEYKNNLFISFSESNLLRPLEKLNKNISGISASSYYSVLIDNNEKVFFQRNVDEKNSIASLSKLMTAVIVLENYNLKDKIIISQKAVDTFGGVGNLKAGEIFSIDSLLKMTLIESNNDAAEALAEKIGRSNFISLMNKKAFELNMKDTNFINPTGLDFNESNISTIDDLKKLILYIIEKHPLISEILSISEINIHHKIETTNILLNENNSYIWGKTGFTDKAGECIVLIMQRPFSNDKNSYIINIIINSKDRFRDARIMEQWIKESFYW
ncbi:MAG: serine hydrolase [Candidatus Pacebacteria bacterium]|nr:serine hydrolase [Candidatus Paceibacterota bacterium]